MVRFKIKTLGCKVNQYESQAIRELLIGAGYQEADSACDAQLCIVNTCTVTMKADRESRNALNRFLKENPAARVIAAGCYVQQDADLIRGMDDRIELLDNAGKLDKAKLLGSDTAKICCDMPKTEPGITYLKEYTKAFIKVQDGCDNFCSYCKVPLVRGRSRSRNPDMIIYEAKQLIDNGYKELILTGICLGDFGKDLHEVTLTWLIKKISAIAGDFRIRLSSIELKDVTDELIELMTGSERLCNHLHIPLQSGSDEILSMMNRRYTAEEFLDRIAYIRSRIPETGITTDIIVGFPGETEEDFRDTISTIEKLRPSRAHIFTYNPRPGTKAYALKDDIDARSKHRRYLVIKESTDRSADEFEREVYRRTNRVLVEDARDKMTGMLMGYTDNYTKVLLNGQDDMMGQLINMDLSHAPCLT